MSDTNNQPDPATTTVVPAEQVDMALRRMVMSFCAPLWWESARQIVVRSGTMCVIQTPEAVIGITNNHVLTSYERHKLETPDVFCQLGSAPFDLSANLIERSERWDLATFSIPVLTLEHWGHQVASSLMAVHLSMCRFTSIPLKLHGCQMWRHLFRLMRISVA